MLFINALALAGLPVYNAEVPQEGPVAVPVTIDFTAATQYTLDLSQAVNLARISLFQTIFIDANGCTQNITVSIQGSNQDIVVKPNTQGYYPIVCPNPAVLVFTCTGGVARTRFILLNIPVAPGSWATA